MPLGQARAALATKPAAPSKRAHSSSKAPSSVELKRFKKDLKDVNLQGPAVALLVLARKLIGSAGEPKRHPDLLKVMTDVEAGRFSSAPDEPWMRKHAAKAFAEPVWMGQFEAFKRDEAGGLSPAASAHHRLAGFHVLAELFTWYWAVTSGIGASDKAVLCPSSLFQAITNDYPTAVRLWSPSAGMFVGGAPSPIAYKAGTQTVKGAQVGSVPNQAEVVAPVHTAPGVFGRGYGVGAQKKACNYCRVQRKVTDTSHVDTACPFWAHAKEQRIRGGLAPPVSGAVATPQNPLGGHN